MKTYLSFFFCFFFVVRLFAQEAPKVKFEKVSAEEMKMTVYEPDTAAQAVILFDDGSSDVSYDNQQGFMLTYRRFVRIKILKQSGTDWGNFSIPIYSSDKNKEEIRSVKGTTFNIENGKVVKTEMKKESVFKERENKYWEMVRLSLPSVKAGSVFDLKYEIYSPLLWNLRTWKFQYLIPVKWSQYEVVYPEYFIYNHSSLGYHRLNPQKQTTRSVNLNYTTTSETSGNSFSGTTRQIDNHSIPYNANVYEYSASDVPAMKEEPYLTTLENFTTKVKFELSVTDLTKIGGQYKSYTNSWNTIAEKLIGDSDFGGQIKSANFAKEEIDQLSKGKTDEMQKMIAIFDYVQHSVKWDGTNDFSPSKSVRKTFNDKTGNSADINLLLIAMLNEAGIAADPVILSTRKNGMISPAHPTLSDCNYLISRTMINGREVLLDATEPDLPAGTIPYRCLNGQGKLIKKESVEDVELANGKSGESTAVFVKVVDGKFTGNVISSEMGLSAFDFRESVKNAGGEKEYFDKLKNKSTDIHYVDYKYTNLDSIYLAVEKKYNFILQNDSEADADILYFNPVLFKRLTENPFTAPTREYPVDYGMPFFESYQLNLTVPDGYKVEELPQSKSFSLQDKSGSFIYSVAMADNNIVFSLRLTINKPIFLPDEYKMLQEFYNLIIAKESEQLVLKKI